MSHMGFISVDHYEELERRLRGRGSETEEKVRKRLETARTEISKAYLYDCFVVNDSVKKAAERILKIIKEYRN